MKIGYARVSTDDQKPALQLDAPKKADCEKVFKDDGLSGAVRNRSDTATGRAMWQMIGVLAELERSLITERTRAGITAARKRGVKFGRKLKLDAEQLEHARETLDQGKDRQHVARVLKVSRTTLYRALAAS